MVLSGSMAYYSEPVNLSDNWDLLLLQCVESNTSPTFVLVYDNMADLKRSDFPQYYSTDFAQLKEDILSTYQEIARQLAPVANSAIQDHRRLANEVTETVYENGVRVLVNYGAQAYEQNGVLVPAQKFQVIT